MFLSNETAETEVNQSIPEGSNLDKFTLWLIRFACIFIIIFFSGLFLAIPILISLLKTQYINISIGLKDVIKSFLELYLD